MAKRGRFDGAIGRAAIYDDAAGDAPFNDPLNNLSLLHFHSDLDYIGLSSATPLIDSSITLNGSVSAYDILHTLAAHGKSGTPFVFGRCQNVAGVWLPFAGTVPVYTVVNAGQSTMICLTLAVNATNVLIAESRSFLGGFANVSIPVKIWVSEQLA